MIKSLWKFIVAWLITFPILLVMGAGTREIASIFISSIIAYAFIIWNTKK